MSATAPAAARNRRRLLAALGVLGLVGLIAWTAGRAIDPAAFERAFSDVHWPWVILSAAAYAVCQVTSALVWHHGLAAGGIDSVSRIRAIGTHWIARGASEFATTPVGDAARLAVLRRHPPTAGACGWRIAGSIGAYRLIDGAVSFMIVAALALAVPLPPGYSAIRWVGAGVLVTMALIVVVLWRVGPAAGMRPVPRRFRPRVRRITRGAALFTSRRRFAWAMALQVATVVGRIGSLAALLAAFGIPAAAAPLVFCLTVLAGLLAISPGGIGIREAAVVPVVMATYGVAAEPVLAFSLAVQATGLVVSAAGALAALAVVRLTASRPAGAPARP